MYYAGIGSRKTPPNVLKLMAYFADVLESKGYILRSGGAEGADSAFASSIRKKEIFRPRDATLEAIELAMSIHPAPQNCNSYVRKLHGRNAQIILGRNLDTPVDFVICWTPGGKSIGGTGLGIKLAKKNGIKVYNIYSSKNMAELKDLFTIDTVG